HGFEMADALDVAQRTYVNVNIHQAENADRLKMLAQLPDSCVASADCLERKRAIFEEQGVFSPALIDGILKQLRAYEDTTLREHLSTHPDEMEQLVKAHFHCG
ncbi:MAG: glutamine synthetase, partial [Mediterranea sp.]|nr:glutamine synthetase [Mediterranea sp.]